MRRIAERLRRVGKEKRWKTAREEIERGRGGKRVEKTEEDRVAACLCIQKDLKHFNKARLERPDLLAKGRRALFKWTCLQY